MSAIYQNNGYLSHRLSALQPRGPRRAVRRRFPLQLPRRLHRRAVAPQLPAEVMLELTRAARPPPRRAPRKLPRRVSQEGPRPSGGHRRAARRGQERSSAGSWCCPREAAADLLALWVLHTHAFDAAWATPVPADHVRGARQRQDVAARDPRGRSAARGWHAVNPSRGGAVPQGRPRQPDAAARRDGQLPARRSARRAGGPEHRLQARRDRRSLQGERRAPVVRGLLPEGVCRPRRPIDSWTRCCRARSPSGWRRRLQSEKVDMWIAPLRRARGDRAARALRGVGRRSTSRRWPTTRPICSGSSTAPPRCGGRCSPIAELAGGDWHGAERGPRRRHFATGGDDTDDVPDQVQILLDIRDAFGDEDDDLDRGPARAPQRAR